MDEEVVEHVYVGESSKFDHVFLGGDRIDVDESGRHLKVGEYCE